MDNLDNIQHWICNTRDWKSNKYVSEGRVNEIVGVWEKQILRLLEHPEERGRIYFVDKSR